jgi:AcrR family transcriptional regulator
MGRWAPDGRGRLEQAAMELYAERGFENTTVAAIAARAGLTERTFFRHFTDKREVLFWGAAALQELLVGKVDAAPAALPAIEVITAAFCSAADEFFEGRRDAARQRQAIIDANAELQERELIKLGSFAAVLADALRRRGVTDPASRLAAETGVSVFKVGFGQWVHDTGERTLAEHVRASLQELRDITGGRSPAVRRRNRSTTGPPRTTRRPPRSGRPD